MDLALAILAPMLSPDGGPVYLPSGRRRFAGTRFAMPDPDEAERLCRALDLAGDLALLRAAHATVVEVDLDRLREAEIDPARGAVNGQAVAAATCDRLHAVRLCAERFGARAFLEAS